MEPVLLIFGQRAAEADYLAIDDKIDSQDLVYEKLSMEFAEKNPGMEN